MISINGNIIDNTPGNDINISCEDNYIYIKSSNYGKDEDDIMVYKNDVVASIRRIHKDELIIYIYIKNTNEHFKFHTNIQSSKFKNVSKQLLDITSNKISI